MPFPAPTAEDPSLAEGLRRRGPGPDSPMTSPSSRSHHDAPHVSDREETGHSYTPPSISRTLNNDLLTGSASPITRECVQRSFPVGPLGPAAVSGEEASVSRQRSQSESLRSLHHAATFDSGSGFSPGSDLSTATPSSRPSTPLHSALRPLPKLPPKPSPDQGLFPTQHSSRSFYLLWLGVGCAATLQSFGYSAFTAQSVGAFFVSTWAFQNIEKSTMVWEFFLSVMRLFFREFASRGAHKIPLKDGCILCIAPHHNQFLDPLVVGGACVGRRRDPIGYVVAAFTLRRPYVGDVVGLFDPIPVERPQDVCVECVGEGKILGRGVTVVCCGRSVRLERGSGTGGGAVVGGGAPAPPSGGGAAAAGELLLQQEEDSATKDIASSSDSAEWLEHRSDRTDDSLPNFLSIPFLAAGSTIFVKRDGKTISATVEKVVSAVEIRLKHPLAPPPSCMSSSPTAHPLAAPPKDPMDEEGAPLSPASAGTDAPTTTPNDDHTAKTDGFTSANLKISPAMEHKTFFKACIDRLSERRLVGYFPEGGSHDRTKMLELKPGIALLALEASMQLKKPVPIVPVGLNYFRGHQFRSRVFVDIEDAVGGSFVACYPEHVVTQNCCSRYKSLQVRLSADHEMKIMVVDRMIGGPQLSCRHFDSCTCHFLHTSLQ